MSLSVKKIIDDRRSYMLPVLKRYVGAVDESQDAILQQMLTTAALEIQEHADISVLPCEMELRVENNDSELVRLYQTPKEVISVTTADGQSVDYVREGRRIRTAGVYESLVIDYVTEPIEGECGRLMALVFQYATALYDGQTDELIKIIAQC